MSYSETITRTDLTNILNKILPVVQHTAIVGEIIQYAGDTAPIGWLMCDGSAVSRTTYAELFNVIGTTYGSGDGSTTFNVPDLRDNFAVGAGTTYELGDTGGEATVTLTTDGIPAHTHGQKSLSGTFRPQFYTGQSASGIASMSSANYNLKNPGSGSIMGAANVTINATHEHTSVGGGEAHENRPPYIALNYIIYAGVDDEGLIAADYIVEQGTSDIWTYRKWNSGVAECWGTYSFSSASFSTTGNVYYRTFDAIPFPTSLFNAEPFATASVQMGNMGGCGITNKQSTKVSVGVLSAVSSARSGYIYIYAKGTWK